MAQVMSEKQKRKLHYKALVIGTLKALKIFIKDEHMNEVLDECIDIADKLGDGYKLCKVDEAIERMEEVKEGYYFKEAMDVAINILREACDEVNRC